MSRLFVFLLATVSFSAPVTLARSQLAHAPDGGTREMIPSISVPPIPDAPFSATVNTEWTRYFEGQATSVLKNHRLIARDRAGRVFQERRFFATDGDQRQTRLTQTEIADPEAHTLAICDSAQRACDLRSFTAEPVLPHSPASGLSKGGESVTRVDLGRQMINGFEADGSREVRINEPAATGADRPISVTKEFWYSQLLGINLITKRSDPRGGLETFTVSDINLSDPDPALFVPPKTAKIIDHRTSAR